MRLREHPKIQWPPQWSQSDEKPFESEEGILRDVETIGPTKLLLSKEKDGKLHFAELSCATGPFASTLHERIRSLLGRPVRELGDLDF